MRRREFFSLLGGIAAAIPTGVRAQQTPLIGYLATIPLSQHESLMAAFRRGMEQAGFVEGRNVRIEYRSADGRTERLPMLAAELAGYKINLLTGMGGITAALAAKAATSNVPIVFAAGDADPVQAGLIQSLSRPGGNVTGFSFLGGMLGAKRLEILRELVPRAEVIGVLINPLNKTTEIDRRELEAAVIGGRQSLITISVGPNGDLASAFAASEKIEALVVTADPTFTNRRTELAVLTARLGIPAIYQWNLFVQAGGLISYGAELADGYRQAGVYAARVLKGEKPADLPVLQPTKFVLSINLKTATRVDCAADAPRPRRRGDRIMWRREFITLLGGEAAAWPLAARAEQGKRVPRIGPPWLERDRSAAGERSVETR